MKHLLRKNILELKPYSSARDEFKGNAAIFLDANENPFNQGLNRYPDPYQKVLKEKVSALKGIPVNQIFLGNGSDEPIDILLRMFCQPGEDAIITLPPTYGMYKVSADIAGVTHLEVPLQLNFQPNPEEILKVAGEKTKILFICSPNNPTGNHIEIEIIEELLQKFNGIIVVDEAYIDFSSKPSALPLLSSFQNLVVLQTFSKAWGLAGLRLGMAFSSPELISFMNKVKAPYNLSILTQQTALEYLEKKEKVKQEIETIIKEREKLEEELSTFSFVQKIYPSDANFLLIKVEEPHKIYEFLVGHGIIVRDRSSVLNCENTLRITIGTPEENQQLIDTLKKYEKSIVY
jgi:histidinol-phosphate aminotransferase